MCVFATHRDNNRQMRICDRITYTHVRTHSSGQKRCQSRPDHGIRVSHETAHKTTSGVTIYECADVLSCLHLGPWARGVVCRPNVNQPTTPYIPCIAHAACVNVRIVFPVVVGRFVGGWVVGRMTQRISAATHKQPVPRCVHQYFCLNLISCHISRGIVWAEHASASPI